MTKVGGRKAVSDEEKRLRGDRVRELREAFKFTQDQVAERSGGLLKRTYVTRMETGDNAASTVDMQRGLSNAFGTAVEDLSPYLAGKITLADLLEGKLAKARAVVQLVTPPERTVEKPLRYPRMRPALDVGRDLGYPEEFIQEFAAEGHDLDEDASSEIWIGVMKASFQRWSRLRNDAGFAKSEDAKAERFTTEKEAELAPKLPGKSPPKSPKSKPKK